MRTGESALKSAQKLFEEGFYRGSVSRSYYAAYSFLSGALVRERGVSPWNEREGPSHASLPNEIAEYLAGKTHKVGATKLTREESRIVRRDLRTLYQLRVAADYRPSVIIRRIDALSSLQDATFIGKTVQTLSPHDSGTTPPI